VGLTSLSASMSLHGCGWGPEHLYDHAIEPWLSARFPDGCDNEGKPRQIGVFDSGEEFSVADQRGVAGYYRVSVARDDMKAPELYSDEITRYCGYRNLVVKEIFSDIDYSGYNNSERRPALNELVRRRHEFSAVIVPKLSRFGRSLEFHHRGTARRSS
jgi:hypothetical protein